MSWLEYLGFLDEQQEDKEPWKVRENEEEIESESA